jgi:tyrosine phenol-lyase
VADVHERREHTRGLEMVFEPTYLRFFQARFRPLEES